MKNSTYRKRVASPEDIVRLARKTKWCDVKLSSGEIVTSETTQQIFEDAAKVLNSKSRRKRVHVAVV
ncbi:MAG: hypothetical protein O2960_03050 [Verrucomicrobia bacterium]|nr:hypothetical protein [Verrucomicrobiota bacterium]